MDWPLIMGFVLIATVLEVSPGANFALITKSASTGGRSAALANIPGFSAAFLLQGALSIFGVAAVLAASPGLLNVIQLVGAIYLLYLGVQAFTPQRACQTMATAGMTPGACANDSDSVWPAERGSAQGLLNGFKDGFITNCLNPKISLFYYAVFPQITVGAENLVLTSFFLVFIHIAVSAIWFSLVAVALCQLLRSSGSERIEEWLRKGSGVALIGFSMYFATGVALALAA